MLHSLRSYTIAALLSKIDAVSFVAVRWNVGGRVRGDLAGSGGRLGSFGAIGIFVVIVVTVGCGRSCLVIDFIKGTLGNTEQFSTGALFVAIGFYAHSTALDT